MYDLNIITINNLVTIGSKRGELYVYVLILTWIIRNTLKGITC